MVRALALVLLLGATGAATPASPPPVEQLADRLRDQTLPFVERAEVLGVRVHQAGPGGERGDLLALLLARLQAAGMGAADADRAPPNSFDRLLDVELTSDGTALTASARLYALAGSLWPIAPRLEHLLYATVALHTANVPLSTAHGPLALRRRTFAVDSDNDDVRALAVTLAQHVPTVLVAGRDLAAYALTPEGTAVLRWRSALTAPLAASWPRTPLASLAVDETSVVVRSSERARAERHRLLNGALDDRPAPEPTLGLGSCALEPGVDWFVAHGCGDGRWPARFYAPAARTVDGHGVRAAIALDPDASLWVARDGDTGPVRAPHVGAQLALAKLVDGLVVATTQPVARGRDDELVVRALDGTVRFASGPLPGSIRALASGDSDGDGNDELWAAVCRGSCQLYVWQ